MDTDKGILRSLTIKGGIVMLLGYLASKFGARIAGEDLTKVVEIGAEVIGGIMVLVGRYRAGGITGVIKAPEVNTIKR